MDISRQVTSFTNASVTHLHCSWYVKPLRFDSWKLLTLPAFLCLSTKVGLYGSPIPWGLYAFAGIFLKFLWRGNFPGYLLDSPLNIILKRYQMVGLHLSHTHLLCHILFWLTNVVLFIINVSFYSIITCSDPFLPLYFIRLLGSNFF